MELLILTLIIAASLASNDPSVEEQWKSFKTDFKKAYKSSNEEAIRYRNFEKNLNKINDHNEQYRKGLVSYTLGVNQFADLTPEEIAANINQSQLKPSQRDAPLLDLTADRPPPRKNWKKEQFVTPVEDQGDDCKASWAFSTIGAIESNYAIKHGKDKLFILSAQNLIDCTNVYGNDSCLGGRPQDALHYVYEEGIMNEDDYPYEGLDRPCEYDQSKSITNLSKYRRIPSGKEEKLKKVVGLRGPVVVSIHATEKFSFYNNGIFYDKSCTSVSSNLNYSVLVVGYDDIDDKKYWILKNSMGTKWGINGYMYLARNKKNHCGIATDAFLPVLP